SIARLAESFATQVLSAIRGASLEDIAALSGGRVAAPARGAAAAAPARRGRRGADVSGLTEKVADLLRGKADGLRQEPIRAELGVDKKAITRAINTMLASGALRKEGQKRSTTYFPGSGSPAAPAAKKGGKRGAKRRGKKA